LLAFLLTFLLATQANLARHVATLSLKVPHYQRTAIEFEARNEQQKLKQL
jgi:hypothetical protein